MSDDVLAALIREYGNFGQTSMRLAIDEITRLRAGWSQCADDCDKAQHQIGDMARDLAIANARIAELEAWAGDAKTMIQKVRRAVLMDIWANAPPGCEDDKWAEDWDRALNELVATCPFGEVKDE